MSGDGAWQVRGCSWCCTLCQLCPVKSDVHQCCQQCSMPQHPDQHHSPGRQGPAMSRAGCLQAPDVRPWCLLKGSAGLLADSLVTCPAVLQAGAPWRGGWCPGPRAAAALQLAPSLAGGLAQCAVCVAVTLQGQSSRLQIGWCCCWLAGRAACQLGCLHTSSCTPHKAKVHTHPTKQAAQLLVTHTPQCSTHLLDSSCRCSRLL